MCHHDSAGGPISAHTPDQKVARLSDTSGRIDDFAEQTETGIACHAAAAADALSENTVGALSVGGDVAGIVDGDIGTIAGGAAATGKTGSSLDQRSSSQGPFA